MMCWIVQSFRVVFTGLSFFGFGLGGCILSWLVLPVAHALGRTPLQKRSYCQYLVRQSFVCFHDFMRITRLIHFNSRSVDQHAHIPPMVMIANHPTLIDVTALLSAYSQLCCVVKASLFRNFLLGNLLRYCGHICAEENETMDTTRVLQQALERLAEGYSVLIFPEGTRSPREGLRRFRRGAFEIALRARVPILPVIITAYPPALMKGVPWYKMPWRVVDYRVKPGPAEWPPAFSESTHYEENSRLLRQEYENRYKRELDLCPPSSKTS